MNDIHVYRVPLPPSCHEAIAPDADDDGYTVYINKDLPDKKAVESYYHALRHIAGKDFELHDVQSVEYTAHK